MIEITDAQANYIIDNSKIPDEIINSKGRVAVFLTQDWCPQWRFMQKFLLKLEEDDLNVFYLSYDQKPYFREFMNVKERVWENYHVPFILYFREGSLINSSNFTGKAKFLLNFN